MSGQVSDFTDYLYFGMRDGECRASGWKMVGKGAERRNAKMVADWIKRGMDVVTLHKDAPETRRLFDQMYARATKTSSKT